MGIIIYNGVSSANLGNYFSPAINLPIRVAQSPDFTIPKRDFELTHVNGINGDIVYGYDSFQNGKRKYSCSIENPYYDQYCQNPAMLRASTQFIQTALSRWLHTRRMGYAILTDDYDSAHIYYAIPADNEIEITNLLDRAVGFDLEFSTKPQRYIATDMQYMGAVTPVSPSYADMIMGYNSICTRTGYSGIYYPSYPQFEITVTSEWTGHFRYLVHRYKNSDLIGSLAKWPYIYFYALPVGKYIMDTENMMLYDAETGAAKNQYYYCQVQPYFEDETAYLLTQGIDATADPYKNYSVSRVRAYCTTGEVSIRMMRRLYDI